MDETALEARPALPALPETEHPLAKVPMTPELEEFLWDYHMRQDMCSLMPRGEYDGC